MRIPAFLLALLLIPVQSTATAGTTQPIDPVPNAAMAIASLSTPAFDPTARYRAVHIDTLDPKLQPVFEDARKAWLQVLAAHRTTDGRGYFLQRDGNTLITLRSFSSFTEYDALRTFRAHVGQRIGPDGDQAGLKYDAGDVAITSPHNSEVWSRSEDLDYRPAGAAIDEYNAGYMRMVVEQVHTDDYAKAWSEIRTALTSVGYPVGRICFFSMLGSGRTISLWLATDRKAFDSAGSPQAAVAKMLGKARADGLFKRLAAASSDVQVSELLPRPELRSPE